MPGAAGIPAAQPSLRQRSGPAIEARDLTEPNSGRYSMPLENDGVFSKPVDRSKSAVSWHPFFRHNDNLAAILQHQFCDVIKHVVNVGLCQLRELDFASGRIKTTGDLPVRFNE